MDKQETNQVKQVVNSAHRGVINPCAVFFPNKSNQSNLEIPVSQPDTKTFEEVTVDIETKSDENSSIAITFDVPNFELMDHDVAQEAEEKLEADFSESDVSFNQNLFVNHQLVQDDSAHLDVTARYALDRVQVALTSPLVHAQTVIGQSELSSVQELNSISQLSEGTTNLVEQSEDRAIENSATYEEREFYQNAITQTGAPSHKVHKFYDGTERAVKLSKYYPEYEFDVEDYFKDAPVIMEGKGLCKNYHIKTGLFKKSTINAVKNVDFKLRAGETLSIVGESGSGKTTLAKLIANIEKYDSGELFFKNESLKQNNSQSTMQRRKEISVIFQNPHASLNPRKTIYKILEEPLLLNTNFNAEERRSKIEEMIQLVGLKVEHLKRFPHMFSGGQKQRIAIARGLILNPSIVVADEAVSALDVSVQAQILNLMLKLQKIYNLSYIFISHDLSVVKHISHRIMVMYHGDIVEEGTTEEIFHNPQHEYTKTLIASVPKLPEVYNK